MTGESGAGERFYASDQAWEIFLGHLATMSACAASRLPGMPSSKAFEHRRARDPIFDQRARGIIDSRRIPSIRRGCCAPEQWTSFLKAVVTWGVSTVCRRPGMPSEEAVRARRARDAEFAGELAAILASRKIGRAGFRHAVPKTKARGPRPAVHRGRRSVRVEKSTRPPDVTFREQLSENGLYAAVMAALPAHLPPIARDDVAADMMLAVLDGQLELGDLESRAKEFVRRHWKMFGTFRVVSLDAPAGPTGNATIGDFLRAAPVDALEEMPDDDAPEDEEPSGPFPLARHGTRTEGRGQSYDGKRHAW